MAFTQQDIEALRAEVPEEMQPDPESSGVMTSEFSAWAPDSGIQTTYDLTNGHGPSNSDFDTDTENAATPDDEGDYDRRSRNNHTQQTQTTVSNIYMIGGVAYTTTEVRNYADRALENFDAWYQKHKEHFESREDARAQLNDTRRTGKPTDDVRDAIAEDTQESKHRYENQHDSSSMSPQQQEKQDKQVGQSLKENLAPSESQNEPDQSDSEHASNSNLNRDLAENNSAAGNTSKPASDLHNDFPHVRRITGHFSQKARGEELHQDDASAHKEAELKNAKANNLESNQVTADANGLMPG